MRELEYRQYAIGSAKGIPKQGTLADLLLDIPSHLFHRFIPPLHILNHLLHYGQPNHIYPNGLPDGRVQYDAGMSGGCAWKPFEVTQEEYDELVLELLTRPGRNLELPYPPEDVQTYDHWWRWYIEQKKMQGQYKGS